MSSHPYTKRDNISGLFDRPIFFAEKSQKHLSKQGNEVRECLLNQMYLPTLDLMMPVDSMPQQNAALAFILPWKELDPSFDVVSLDDTTQGWDILLAGQGIRLNSSIGEIPENCAVATGFNMLDALTTEALGLWASDALERFRPGGLLVLGGTDPDHPKADDQGIAPAKAAKIFRKVGFARVRILHPTSARSDGSLSSALYEAGPRYAIVAQAEAYGKAFDVFSPIFSAAPLSPTAHRLRQAEAALHDRINHVEARLQNQLRQTETDLRNELHRKAAEIAQLHASVAELKHLTRRRGLRKLFHRIKEARRAKRKITHTSSSIVGDGVPKSTQLPAPLTGNVLMHPADPSPLSTREMTAYTRLFDRQAR